MKLKFPKKERKRSQENRLTRGLKRVVVVLIMLVIVALAGTRLL